jgi:hypothetical protein
VSARAAFLYLAGPMLVAMLALSLAKRGTPADVPIDVKGVCG